MINKKPIGVFDSGVGGLTVLEKLKEAFPNENFLYFGDTLRCPYGTKKREELEKIVESDIIHLEKCGCKMTVIACNTATANSYHIKENIPIIRIIEPTANKVKSLAKNNSCVAILATNYTVNSKAYQNKLDGVNSIGVGCSEWVDLIEANKTETYEMKESVERLLKDIKGKVDMAILGCTHFGIARKPIQDFLGNDVLLINSSECLNDEVKNALDNVGYNEGKSETIITFSGDIDKVNMSWFKAKYDKLMEVKIDE